MACGSNLSKNLAVALCELVGVEVDVSGVRRYPRGGHMADQSFEQGIERVVRSHDLALIPLRVRNVLLCILDDCSDLLQGVVWEMRPCLDDFLRYPLCLLLQLHVLLLRLRRLFGNFVYFGVGLAFARLRGLRGSLLCRRNRRKLVFFVISMRLLPWLRLAADLATLRRCYRLYDSTRGRAAFVASRRSSSPFFPALVNSTGARLTIVSALSAPCVACHVP